MHRFSRLFAPKRIAVIGGGAWCEAIVGAAARLGFQGDIIPVHPTRGTLAGRRCAATLSEITEPFDAAFIGVKRHATVEIVRELSAKGAGGAICFASGFSEAQDEDDEAHDLQAALVGAAGDMPLLGPNCYGVLNALDGAGL